ncbi:1,6-anhydro-N-acetylmuramyl-L-alanine amidase AmpD [Rouxiella badensis]|jgi:AmpD protein|uniref:1,6-anhydro-N-acetylmuramyl-L-alanine amidase AmpD n=1 Tax=Rouxiella badensis TaxID=1646377 RepID=A0A1X0WKE3_9GAMM|nr:1,6-anhydro-N-acetylmuramyl-L-alanine amidase AmpD [Rouxiella badensis]MCC3702671.1 1,6-anhydro-N-acetylmuramyl-L-alanine amidase AmpD [Rouxiella badensis]MCC3718854.1 1,6-anhydro-N-acetylmuramyl-L-alanine amidase AmpD [Rouxiella badensis]MCC3727807.1 1,6-anhydro-N-acetylmuramyl-L-alanine amidase AmpD [Rouxiella badensis]MCC3733025.1 1,6-anhydro-N-acetylmuramyl-L-alanine amidase AmpD [Rouxiella badensis]MCC3739551.1 1,6-anhydro-N-acetylmuramyl-L-alanine amidase AmpD [Rouxiella badensis]
MQLKQGWIAEARRVISPHFDLRPEDEIPSLLVIHNISLPPGKFGGPYIDQLFTGTLNPAEDPFFEQIYQLRVAAHCLIRRDGEIVQYVPFDKRAWHAGVSVWQGRERCNDFSIGIELEGTDFEPFTDAQYQSLLRVTDLILKHYPVDLQHITGHSDIAPGRKTDPGPYFDWQRYLDAVREQAASDTSKESHPS